MTTAPNPQLKAAVYGAAVGDALGVPFEFRVRGTFVCTDMSGYGTHHQPAGTWSDDTSMMLATCASIRDKRGRIDPADMRARFCDWLDHGAYTPFGQVFDAGNTVVTALREGRGCASDRSNGNGSLMRIVPLAFTGATDADVAAVSSITHAHPLSVEACVRYVRIARALAGGANIPDAIAAGVADGDPVDPAGPLHRLPRIAELAEADLESHGYVVHTIESALWCLATTSTYADCVLRAVNLGNDTDTTACVAGGLAGIAYGFDTIPATWVEALQAKELIDRCLF